RRANDLGPLRVSRRARGRLARAADAWPARHSSGGRGTLPAPGSGHARTRRLVQRTGSRKGISREASALSVGHRLSREGPGRPDRLLRGARLGGVRQGPSGRVAAWGRRHVVVERIRPRWRRASLGPRRRGRVRAADPGLARAVRRLWAEQFYAGCAVGGLAQVVRRPAGGAEAGESCW